MIAFIFPGQGSQKVGMGQALVEAFPEARAAFRGSRSRVRRWRSGRPPPLSTLCFEGPEDRLALTEITQPAILDDQHRGVPRARVEGRPSRLRRRAQPR